MNQPATYQPADAEREYDSLVILGVRVLMMTSAEVRREMMEACASRRCAKVYIPNAATLNLASADPAYRKVLNDGDFVLRDGIGLQMAAWLRGTRFPENLVGTDLTPAFCRELGKRGMSMYLLGGRPGVAERAAQKLVDLSPGLKLAGCRNGYFKPDETDEVIAEINSASPDLLVVAFGNPLQERWIRDHAAELKVGVAIGVGGLVDHLAGELKRAPMWMRKSGLEWLHILLGQPHKWRRYVLGNPLFLARIGQERASGLFKGVLRRGRTALKKCLRWTVSAATARSERKLAPNTLRILTYHDVQERGGDYDAFCVRASDFRRQMEILKKSWNVLSISEAFEALQTRRALPAKAVVITFDDGYRGVLEHAAPILYQLGLPATVFLRCDVLDAGREPGLPGREKNYITWQEARHLLASGFELGSHTLTHRPLSRLTTDEMRREIHESKSLLERELRTGITFFSYPYGTGSECDARLLQCVQEAGYAAGLTSLNGANVPGTDVFALQRNKVERTDSLGTFVRILRGGMDLWRVIDKYGSAFQERGDSERSCGNRG